MSDSPRDGEPDGLQRQPDSSGPLRVLVTGGAGFIGANLGVQLAARHPDWQITVFDNLRRRGAELNLSRLRDAGVRFVHGDVRDESDLRSAGEIDALVECSAEPSALAGTDGETGYALRSNLVGAYHCLELARRERAQFVFLSTSRVYPYTRLDALPHLEGPTRFDLATEQAELGVTAAGVAENLPLDGPRTLYGATKLAAELLVTEYAATFDMPTVVNRCGVVAGPWQMGKVDQGVFTFWLLSHYFRRDLVYLGYGGTGKQVRDLLHVDDLVRLIDEQLSAPDSWAGATVNVGGGREMSLSLRETTDLCQELTGNRVTIRKSDERRPGDVRIYLSDCAELHRRTEWRPSHNARRILSDTLAWISEHEGAVRRALVG